MEKYTVQRGDTFASLSRRFYGDEQHAGVIWEANKSVVGVGPTADDLHFEHAPFDENNHGQPVVLTIPDLDLRSAAERITEQRSSEQRSIERVQRATQHEEQEYTVQKGDSFGSISQHFYGDASHARELWEANRQVGGVGRTPDDLNYEHAAKPVVLTIPPLPQSEATGVTGATDATGSTQPNPRKE